MSIFIPDTIMSSKTLNSLHLSYFLNVIACSLLVELRGGLAIGQMPSGPVLIKNFMRRHKINILKKSSIVLKVSNKTLICFSPVRLNALTLATNNDALMQRTPQKYNLETPQNVWQKLNVNF